MFKTPNGHVFQALLASRRIKRMIEDVVLAAYAKWEAEQQQALVSSSSAQFSEVSRG